jgi:tetratricopeptide (TPR) repeat protein
MRVVVSLLFAGLALAQPPDPAYAPLARAYQSLKARDYEAAIPAFLLAIAAAPARADIRKDLAYAYLKTGENALALDQFRAALRLDPADMQVALETAFLANETSRPAGPAEARRIFDRIRKTGNPVAEQAFHNIDDPLAAGIVRWQAAIADGADNFSAHYELATIAEQRDELALAADHYRKAWRLLPDRRGVLVDLGRVWLALDREADGNAALLAASRGGQPRAAELARELLPDRYPFVSEFRRALEIDPANAELRRELAYLFLRLDRQPEAEVEFRVLTETVPGDLLSATQLGFLLYARGERTAAQPLFDRVLAGDDEDLANRVRAVLRLPQLLRRGQTSLSQGAQGADSAPRGQSGLSPVLSPDAKVMAERSIKAGYIKDALKYLQVAHEADPGDFDVMRKLGWTLNILHQDRDAVRWFDLARQSPDPEISSEAGRAWRSLRRSSERWRTSFWLYPIYSTRWTDFFTYGQLKTELRTALPVQPYLSLRIVGDSSFYVPQSLSEQSVILAAGLTTSTFHGARAWFEAGTAVGYISHHALPDYRGGLSLARRFGRLADTTLDALYVSRFGKDFLAYDQTRLGRVTGPLQFYWNLNITADTRRQPWANFAETGPGLRLTLMPSSYFTVNLLRGAYLMHDPTRRPNFTDLRTGFWYAFSH